MKAHRMLAVLAILIFSFLFSAASGQSRSLSVTPEDEKLIVEQTRVFMEILVNYAAFSLDKPADLRACAQEMLRMKPNEQSCRDKHSAWYSKEEYQETLAPDIQGKFGGVGLEVSEQDGKVVVVSPIDGTPAYRAGLKPGDVIVKVDGTAAANIMDAVKRMRGKSGVAVEIIVDRSGREITFKVIREVITVHAVSAKIICGFNIP